MTLPALRRRACLLASLALLLAALPASRSQSCGLLTFGLGLGASPKDATFLQAVSSVGLEDCCQACLDLEPCCVWNHVPLGENSGCFLFSAGQYGSYASPTGEATGFFSAEKCEGTAGEVPE